MSGHVSSTRLLYLGWLLLVVLLTQVLLAQELDYERYHCILVDTLDSRTWKTGWIDGRSLYTPDGKFAQWSYSKSTQTCQPIELQRPYRPTLSPPSLPSASGATTNANNKSDLHPLPYLYPALQPLTDIATLTPTLLTREQHLQLLLTSSLHVKALSSPGSLTREERYTLLSLPEPDEADKLVAKHTGNAFLTPEDLMYAVVEDVAALSPAAILLVVLNFFPVAGPDILFATRDGYGGSDNNIDILHDLDIAEKAGQATIAGPQQPTSIEAYRVLHLLTTGKAGAVYGAARALALLHWQTSPRISAGDRMEAQMELVYADARERLAPEYMDVPRGRYGGGCAVTGNHLKRVYVTPQHSRKGERGRAVRRNATREVEERLAGAGGDVLAFAWRVGTGTGTGCWFGLDGGLWRWGKKVCTSWGVC